MSTRSWNVVAAAVAASALASAYAETYYHIGADNYGNSSFDKAKVSDAIGWSTSQNGAVVSSIADWAGSDFIVSGANSLRIPATDSDIAFAGRSLAVNGSTIAFKRASTTTALNRNVTMADLRFTGTGGTLDHGEGKSDHGSNPTVFYVKGAISIADGATMTLGQSFNSNNDTREFVIDSAVSGGESASIAFRTLYSSGASNGTAPVTFNSLENFYGTFKVDSTTTTPYFNLTVNGAFNGSVTSLPANTTAATFDFDGLPAGKGIRIKGTNPGAPVLQKMRVYSATADFTAPGLVIATFEDISSPGVVENLGWSMSYSGSADGTFGGLHLKAVANGDGTVSLVTAEKIYYKTGSDSGYVSSLPVASRLASGWSLRPGGGASAVEAANIAGADFVVSGGNVLRTVDNQVFGGKSLKVSGPGDGSSYQVAMKHSQEGNAKTPDTTISSTIAIGNFVFSGGAIFLASNNLWFKFTGGIEIEAGRSFDIIPVNSENSYALRRLEVESAVAGGADTSINLYKVPGATKSTAGAFHLVFDDLENFQGVLNDNLPVASWVAGDSYLLVKGRFGGRLGTMNANPGAFIVNYDGLPEGKGLVAATTAVPEKLKSGTVFYASDVTKFTTDGTVLATFPAGTVVDPAQFSFKYASSWDGQRSDIPLCRAESGENGETQLVVDFKAPVFAKMVKDAETEEYAWHFYLANDNGGLGEDVTETCGKTVPDNAMVVLFSSKDELAAISANAGNAREYRLTSFTCTADTDFSAAPFATTPVSGLSIDPAGFRVTVSAAFANAVSAVTSETAGSEFCVNVPAGGSETLDGPAISGTVRFVKAGAGTLFCFKADQTYTGGNKVEAGVLSAPKPPAGELGYLSGGTENNGEIALKMDSAAYSAARRYFGAAGGDIAVAAGAVFDVYGNYGYHVYRIVLDGGTLRSVDMNNVNTGLSDKNIHQNEKGSGSGNILLTADSSLRFRSNVILSDGTVDLGGHALDVYCKVGDKKVLLKCNAANGTIRVRNDGADVAAGLKIAGSAQIDASTVTLIDEAGLRVATAFTVSNYTARLEAKYWKDASSGLYTGQAQMTVLDTFRPEGRYFHGCTMADGSTLDLGAWDFASWGAFKPLSTGSRNGGKIDFAGGTVTIGLAGRNDVRALATANEYAGTYLFKWGEGAVAPGAGVAFKLDGATEGCGYELVDDETGLKIAVARGFMIRIANRDINITRDWMEDNCEGFDIFAIKEKAAEYAQWLEAAGANGLPRWQSWLLGLTPGNPSSVVICEAAAVQPSNGSVSIVARNVDVKPDAGATVTAYLDRSTNGTDWTTESGGGIEVASGPVSFDTPLSDAGSLCFFRIRVVVQ